MIKHDWTDGDKWYDRWRSWKPEEIIARKQNKRSEARLRALADNRCVVGFYRYELERFGRPSIPTGQKWDLVGKAMDKLEAYRQTGNKENLVDVYNYIRWEWTWPGHARAHFAPQDQGIEGALTASLPGAKPIVAAPVLRPAGRDGMGRVGLVCKT